MSTLVGRGAVLVVARLLNYAVLLLSPIFLVRLLDMRTYGMYREFMLYGMALIVILGFSIANNLQYFLPLRPGHHALVMMHTTLMLLFSTTAGLLLLAVSGQDWLLAHTSFDFAWQLGLWVFLFLNFDFLENYWIAIGSPEYVVPYTVARGIARLAAVVAAAAITSDIRDILLALIAVEAIKAVGVVAWLWRAGFLRLQTDWSLLREQIGYIVPLGAAAILLLVNDRLGQFLVSSKAGPAALAVFTIGTYQIPIMSIVRSAVADTMFPDIVRSVSAGTKDGLLLWRRATALYAAVVFPVLLSLMVHAETFINTLFTREYETAVPLFRVALCMLLFDCFDFQLLLRVRNANRVVLGGNIVALLVHLPAAIFFFSTVGMVGVVLARLLAELVIAVYFMRAIFKLFGVALADLAEWRELGRIATAALLPAPLLIGVLLLDTAGTVLVLVSVAAYLVAYVLVALRLDIREVRGCIGVAQRALARLG